MDLDDLDAPRRLPSVRDWSGCRVRHSGRRDPWSRRRRIPGLGARTGRAVVRLARVGVKFSRGASMPEMLSNSAATMFPFIRYHDARVAIAWLVHAFGLDERAVY